MPLNTFNCIYHEIWINNATKFLAAFISCDRTWINNQLIVYKIAIFLLWLFFLLCRLGGTNDLNARSNVVSLEMYNIAKPK